MLGPVGKYVDSFFRGKSLFVYLARLYAGAFYKSGGDDGKMTEPVKTRKQNPGKLMKTKFAGWENAMRANFMVEN